MVLTIGTFFSVAVGVLYLWVFPSSRYPWPHFLLLSFYLFVILSVATVIVSLAGRRVQTDLRAIPLAPPIPTPAVAPTRRVRDGWIILSVVMIILYLLFNGHTAKAQPSAPATASGASAAALPASGATAATQAPGPTATWIGYPGDFEVWLGNQVQNRRTERGSFYPPFWKLDNHYILIDFHKQFDLPAADDIDLKVEGRYNCKLDGKMVPDNPQHLHITAGHHTLDLKVFNQDSPPALFVKGRYLVSDPSWSVTFEDKEWIDASGKASDKSGTTWMSAASWNFNDPSSPPSHWRLTTEPRSAAQTEKRPPFAFSRFW